MGFNRKSNNLTTVVSTRTDTLNAANSGDVFGTAVAGVKNSTVTITDGGAIKAIENVASKSVDRIAESVTKSQAEALGFAQRASESAMTFAHNAGRPESATIQTIAKWAALAAAAVAAIGLFTRGK